MGALAKDSTLVSVLEGLSGYTPDRTAIVKEISFNPVQFESGQIDTTSGNNKSGSGYYRTIDYIDLPENTWIGQLYADKPWLVNILYYDENKEYKEYDSTYTGYCKLKDYPYCRLYFYNQTAYLSSDEFITERLKIQYIENAPAENEYFLHNHLFNGNFEYDRNDDGIGDGWSLQNSPTSSSVGNNTQTIVPSEANYFIRMESDSRLTGHIIYVAFSAYTPNGNCTINLYGTNQMEISQNTGYERSSKLITATQSGPSPRITISSSGVGHAVYLRNIMMIDLTEIFGSGNEPTASQIDAIIDKFYGGYVPCAYVVKYDDSSLPIDVLTRLKNIETGSDKITFSDGMVMSVGHYVGETLKSTINVSRDRFGNIVSIEEVQA